MKLFKLFKSNKTLLSSDLNKIENKDMAEQIVLKVNEIIHVSSEEELTEVLNYYQEKGIKIYEQETESSSEYFKKKNFFNMYREQGKEFFFLVVDWNGKQVIFGHPSTENYTTAEQAAAYLKKERNFMFDCSSVKAMEAFEIFTDILFDICSNDEKVRKEIHSIREFKEFYTSNLPSISTFHIEMDGEKYEMGPEDGVDYYLDILGI